jgi:hypothetical protein
MLFFNILSNNTYFIYRQGQQLLYSIVLHVSVYTSGMNALNLKSSEMHYIMYSHAWRWSYRPKHVELLNVIKLLILTVNKICITCELSTITG